MFLTMNRNVYKLNCYIIEALNAFGTAFYYTYLFFYLQHFFGFDRILNLYVCALGGLFYLVGSFFGGKFSQKNGYIKTLKLGVFTMAAMMSAGMGLDTAKEQIVIMLLWVLGMCLTWPTLEAMISEGEDPIRLSNSIGIYNIIWAAFSALAFFIGGAIVEGFGWKSIFWVPLLIHGLQLIVLKLMKEPIHLDATNNATGEDLQLLDDNNSTISGDTKKAFMQMAWIANPLAYMAANTIIPLVPDISKGFGLSTMLAGFICSIFYISRVVTFVWLWRWTRWHYKEVLFFTACFFMVISFMSIALAPTIVYLICAEIVFGWALGLIYFSSLYYSMHVGDTKGEHGGFHEAAIGAGIFAGPMIGALATQFVPWLNQAGVWFVGAGITVGQAVILIKWLSYKK